MSFWDDEIASCDQYAIDRLTNKIVDLKAGNDQLIRVMQADDVLEIGAEYIKSSNGSRLQVAPDFVTQIKSRSKSLPETISAKHIQTGRRFSLPEYNAMPDKSGTVPISKHCCKGATDKYTVIGYSANEVTVKITKLAHFDKSRYRALIDALIADDIFSHNARKEPTSKRIYNSARQVLRRRFYIKSYEWGLTFNPAISASLYPALIRITKPYEGTFYLHDSKHSQCKIKVYNIDAASRPDEKSEQAYRPGDRLKFEITYKHQYFRENDDLTINRLTLQQEIANILLAENKNLLRFHLFDKLTLSERRDIFSAAGVSKQGEFMSLIDDNRNTQVSTDERIREIEKQLKLLNQAQANLAANQARQDERIAALEDFVGYKNATVDTRKLRKV